MHEYFPEDTKAIDRFLELTDEVAHSTRVFFGSKALPAAIAPVAAPLMRRKFLRLSDRTLGEVLGELTDNKTLKAVLSAQFGDHGLPPGQASFAIHALVFRHYLNGGAFPVGGSGRIAATVAPQIEAEGGQIVVGAEVAKVLIEKGRAVGVEMADGRSLFAPTVISDAGVPNTALKLLPEGSPGRNRLIATVDRIKRSASHVCLYVGIRQTAADLGLCRTNLWIYPDSDQDGAIESYLADPEAPIPLAYVSFPSAKDPDFERRFPGRATVEVVSLANYDWFAPWENEPWLKRGDAYDAVKERLSERLLDILVREVPQLESVIDYHELSTPVSTRHFAGYEHGEIYGLEHTPARFRESSLQPRTPIKGFFLTGQDVCTAGVAGAVFGAVVATSAVLGRNMVKEIMTLSHGG
jgi:all-trans-retinol 13,14-reductase